MNPYYPFKILIKYATKGRPERFFGGMDSIYNLCEMPEHLRVLVTADIDDPNMFNDMVKERVEKYKNAKIIYGTSKGKINAINRDMDILPNGFEDWDILVNFSDDQRFVMPRWDMYLRVHFNSLAPDMDGYLSFLDPDTKGALTTTAIIGRKYYERFGFIYDPIFDSLFCDNMADDAAKALGKYHFIALELIHHYNPSYGYKDFLPDQMYIDQQKIGWTKDKETYYRLKAEGIVNYLLKFEKNEKTI